MSKHRKTDLDFARDELFAQIHRCGVLQATPEQQQEWLEDTLDYLNGRYPSLSRDEAEELREIGIRFCQPVIPHGKSNTALTVHEDELESGAQEQEQELAAV